MFVLSSRVEGNPLSVMEAMAAGLPVVSTAVGGVTELVRDRETGLLVPSEDAAALAQACRRWWTTLCGGRRWARRRGGTLLRISTFATRCVGMSSCTRGC
jgi:glycosyltransferase involved in cell wall biosynthesis